MIWEDLQIMTRAHVLAKAVDVIPDPIYYWRERGKGALSITQSRTDITNLRDRITALLAIDSFLRERGTPGCSGSISARRWSTTCGCTSATCPGPAPNTRPSSSSWAAST